MILIVGLGNIGKKYENTRHNFGFLAIERLASQIKTADWKPEKKFFGMVAPGEIDGEKIIFLKPDTYMNLSGKAVAAVSHFYKIPIEKIWVFCDDIDLPFGKIRFRAKGGSGGHNGLRSIANAIGSENFSRIKFGIANETRTIIPTEKFVLQKFSTGEQSHLPGALEEGIKTFLENK